MKDLRVHVMMGLPGSGKSLYSTKIYGPSVKRISQDELGSRQKCLDSAKAYLEAGFDVVIDRTNISKAQRKHWIDLAKQFKAEATCVWLVADKETCLNRIKTRGEHPTLPGTTPQDKTNKIVSRFEKELEKPDLSEGFTTILIRKN